MKLVLYSGGFEEENLTLDKELLKIVNKKDPLFTFIPACSYDSEIEFKEFVTQYSKFKIERFIHFPVDRPLDQALLRQVLKSDVIHLGGGNTFYFLNSLRKSKMLPLLKKFIQDGGILTGLSAGAIMMTETIEMAAYPPFDCDENEDNLKNLKSLNLVDFYFFPHFKNSKRYDDVFKKYTRHSKKKIYACPDGSGIIISDGKTTFIGKTYLFHRGEKHLINSKA
jgi:dipeptidase E